MLCPSVSVAVMFLTAGLTALCGNLAQPAKVPESVRVPSQLDYLVLASMADSQRPLSMATYRPRP